MIENLSLDFLKDIYRRLEAVAMLDCVRANVEGALQGEKVLSIETLVISCGRIPLTERILLGVT